MRNRESAAFADHFSAHAAMYAKHRPRYPVALFHWLAVVSPGTALAWDAGTGNGQVATGLVTRFSRVHATDASGEQIAEALTHPRIEYRVASYDTALGDGSVQLITVGQALHWFDLAPFLKEAKRVRQPGAVLAAFAYQHSAVTPEIDTVVRHHHDVTLGAHWPSGREQLLDGYRTLALPIDELAPPPFEMHEDWSLAAFTGYLRSWSATQRYIAQRGDEAIRRFELTLAEAWGTSPRRTIRWPIAIRAGELR